MNSRQSMRCPCCFTEDAAEVRFDKHGRPYVKCRWCESTIFTRRPEGTLFLRVEGDHIGELLDRLSMSPREAQQHFTMPHSEREEVSRVG